MASVFIWCHCFQTEHIAESQTSLKGPTGRWEERHWMEVMTCQGFTWFFQAVSNQLTGQNQFWKQMNSHHAWVLIALLPLVAVEFSAPLLFMESNKFLILSLAGFFFFLKRDTLFATEGSSRAANPQGWLLDGGGRSLPSWCKIQALSLARSTNFCSWLWLTFLLTLREVSKGFWMCSGEDSGLFCSFPCRSLPGRKRCMNILRAQI